MIPQVKQFNEIQETNFRQMQKYAGRNFLFRLYLLKILPMGFFAGLKVRGLNETSCSISVPYRWINKNPFRSTYFAVLGMGAEMSTGLPAFALTYKSKPSISLLITGLKAEFTRKAKSRTIFTFNNVKEMKEAVEKAVQTGEGIIFEAVSEGKDEQGREVAKFILTWSFRVKP